ncbi:putative E3 ubiquitin-protein ligase ARI10 [Silene latifolia]|uniref:putative E3 ubiquitin-protein ligase ARI10 n=1 Tax=Silene latifolia TaxID=37657 RepID=UPI003D7842DF
MEFDDADNLSYNDDEDDQFDYDDSDNNNDEDFAASSSPNPHGADGGNNSNHCKEKRYTILNDVEIKRRQDEEISYVSSVLSLSTSEAILLLCHYNWSTSQLNDDWFANEQQVRTKVGLINNITVNHFSNKKNYRCGICFDDEFSTDEVRSANCGHIYCKTCWRNYVDITIDETGSGCLRLKCPEPKCPAAVDRDMVTELASKEATSKYLAYLIRSYVEFKKKNTKWCPAPGCNNAVEFELGSSDVYDVVCECEHEFCFNCGEEPHRPVKCGIVKEWMLKNSNEAENTKWILAFSKPCPKCKRPIEKNTGCNHMTCGEPCKHHFCWHCGRTLHPTTQYSCNCNGYRHLEPKITNDDDKQREMAKRSIQRYAHYYERWASNNKSRDKALADLTEIKSDTIHLLSENLGIPVSNLDFIFEAWEKIVECRRILKWTYAYGFFSLEHEDKKRELFEYLQGEAERALEWLHSCAERELKVFFNERGDGVAHNFDFKEFRVKLLGLTKVTGTFFENLVKGLENGLSEVGFKVPEPEPEQITNTDSSSIPGQGNANQEIEYWSCDRCSFMNPVWAFTCEICFDE